MAVDAERQAASTAKITTYLAALEKGFSKNTTLFDDPKYIKHSFKPKNFDGIHKGPIKLDDCIAQSRNVCTFELAFRVGPLNISEMSNRLSLTPQGTPGASIILGAAETTLIKNVAAFATIKNEGVYNEPYIIRFILAKYGSITYRHKPSAKNIISAEVSTNMQALLDKVVGPDGTANRALIPSYKTFGKTGTSQDFRDAWFVGFTEHDVTTGIWVGPNDDKTMNGVTGGSLPASIFREFNENLIERFDACQDDFVAISAGFSRDINC